MKNTGNSKKVTKSRRAVPELRIVSIRFNLGPDAQMRLRGIFTLLIKHLERDGQKTPERDSPEEVATSDDSTAENGK